MTEKVDTVTALYLFEENSAYDSNLTLTYEGGCPSRFCKPEGYDSGAGEGVRINTTGMTYEGALINLPTRSLSPNVERLICDIDLRMNYG